MATTPGVSRPATAGKSWSPGPAGEVAECLGGGVHLAYAEGPVSGSVTVAAAFTPEAALARARTRAAALDALHEVPASLPASPAARRLTLADFMVEPPADDTPARVPGVGLLSGDEYLLPAEVVQIGGRDGGVEPTTVGVVEEDVSAAVADLLAHDVVIRWWESPRIPLLRISEHLGGLLPPGLLSAARTLGLRIPAFVLPGADFRIGLVGVSGEGTTVAAAAGRTVEIAIGEAFLRAMAARAQPWVTLPATDSLRRLTVWHREADYLAYLERSAVDADPAALDDAVLWESALDWPDIACRRFGHEPVVVGPGTPAGPVKVVCPGAACYRTAPPGFMLPCPVP
ncbi:hypothetical protein [Microbispora sp. GKU 823]|uniref:hypothetical protein n=1 Tax=Microbispora sp. GKU 823 TaxID=1652100 RepID=UPI0009A3782C|nr:hypothetical protein [Microbispora sp. GKU 823]OPG14609.1 hypothetical protein B1L11_00005 [Microbispora sp. GKU 823]